jgi:hypothetical protein
VCVVVVVVVVVVVFVFVSLGFTATRDEAPLFVSLFGETLPFQFKPLINQHNYTLT